MSEINIVKSILQVLYSQNLAVFWFPRLLLTELGEIVGKLWKSRNLSNAGYKRTIIWHHFSFDTNLLANKFICACYWLNCTLRNVFSNCSRHLVAYACYSVKHMTKKRLIITDFGERIASILTLVALFCMGLCGEN